MACVPSSSAAADRFGQADAHRGTNHARVVRLRLGLLSPQEVERMSACVIYDHAVYSMNLPKLHGPNDPRMGCCDRRIRCLLCRNLWHHCPGHMGVVRLPVALYHAGFFDRTLLYLQAHCWLCSGPLLGRKGVATLVASMGDAPNATVTDAVLRASRGRTFCSCCDAPKPKYARNGGIITRTFTDKQLEGLDENVRPYATRLFTPNAALEILRGITDDDCRAMRVDPVLAHPSWMVLVNLAVLPPNARPTIMAAEGSKRRGQDDITNKTQDVLKLCRKIRKHIMQSLAGAYKPARGAGRARKKQQQAELEANNGVPYDSRLHAAEFSVSTGRPGELTTADVLAVRAAVEALDEEPVVLHVTPWQAAAIWTAHEKLCLKLQDEAIVLFDNSGRLVPQARQRTGAPQRTLMMRLVGKQGQIRGNAVAKRCDQNARTVIIPDAQLDPDELGVPESFATVLTVPEEVCAGSLERLQEAVHRGPGTLGGAARVLRATGELVQLHLLPSQGWRSFELEPGDVVERYIRDGDWGAFNRQPSLHKLSMMAHKLRLIPGQAYRVPLGVMQPYNADCDGDEMNLHIMQTWPAMAEAKHLMAVSRNVINPQNNAPCISVVQDARVGGMLLTRSTTFLSLDAMQQCTAAIRYRLPNKPVMPPPAGTDPRTGAPYWTGKQLVSLLLPPIFLEKRVRGAPPDVTPDDPLERFVRIVNGELVCGALCKATLGPGGGGIVHRICTTYGPEAAVRFIGDFQRVVYAWLPSHGLSIGLRDCTVDAAVQAKVDEVTAECDGIVRGIMADLAELRPHMAEVEAALVEAHVITLLTSVLDYTSRVVLSDVQERVHATDDAAFGFWAMVTAASKGNTNNIAQMMACLGQQIVEGSRMEPVGESARTLSMFPPGAFAAVARGFVRQAYIRGMRPAEYYMHAMAGREGLVATAVKTAVTGYMERVMTKSMETMAVAWDGTVRNAQDYVVMFVAGGDYADASNVERVDVSAVMRAADHDLHVGPNLPRLLALRAVARQCWTSPLYADAPAYALLPLDVRDELKRAAHRAHRRPAQFQPPNDGTDEELAAAVAAMLDDVARYYPSREAMLMFEISTMYECRPEALRALGLGSAAAFRDYVVPGVRQRVQGSLATPGEAVGVVAAQSIGEPSTQFALSVFHMAGLLNCKMTTGLPRLNELVRAAVNIRTPCMHIPFRNDAGLSDVHATRLAHSLRFVCLDTVLESSYVLLDPPGDGVHAPPTTLYKDFGMMAHALSVYGPESDGGAELSPWIVRLVLNRTQLSEHNIGPARVAMAVQRHVRDTSTVVVHSERNDPCWVVRVRVVGDTSERAARDLHARLRNEVLLGGIDGVNGTRVIQRPCTFVDGGTGELFTKRRRYVQTEGSALMNVATRDWADWESTVTNDVQEVAAVLGIVAARAVLYSELEHVVADGGHIDARHIRMVACTMTHRGFVMPLTRHGINRSDISVLQRTSFEEPVDMLLNGAAAAEVDDLRGVCESVMFGQKVPVGTGTVTVQQEHGAVAHHRQMVSSREQDMRRGAFKRFRPDVSVPPPAVPKKRCLVAPVRVLSGVIIATDRRGTALPHRDAAALQALDGTLKPQAEAEQSTETTLAAARLDLPPFRVSSPSDDMLRDLRTASAFDADGNIDPVASARIFH